MHLGIFEQPATRIFFSTLLGCLRKFFLIVFTSFTGSMDMGVISREQEGRVALAANPAHPDPTGLSQIRKTCLFEKGPEFFFLESPLISG